MDMIVTRDSIDEVIVYLVTESVFDLVKKASMIEVELDHLEILSKEDNYIERVLLQTYSTDIFSFEGKINRIMCVPHG